jgi:hypothetical protein
LDYKAFGRVLESITLIFISKKAARLGSFFCFLFEGLWFGDLTIERWEQGLKWSPGFRPTPLFDFFHDQQLFMIEPTPSLSDDYFPPVFLSSISSNLLSLFPAIAIFKPSV